MTGGQDLKVIVQFIGPKNSKKNGGNDNNCDDDHEIIDKNVDQFVGNTFFFSR